MPIWQPPPPGNKTHTANTKPQRTPILKNHHAPNHA